MLILFQNMIKQYELSMKLKIKFCLNKHFKIIDANNEDIENSIQSKFSDFEDGVQYFSALRSRKIDALVTRNVKDYKHALLPVFTPKQWCLR